MSVQKEFQLINETISANNIPDDADFLQLTVSKVHADGFTLGLAMDGEDESDTSTNHWAIILQADPSIQVRLSMESRKNKTTKGWGVLIVRPLGYTGPSRSVVHRETYSWKGPGTTVREILEHALSLGWHKYRMAVTDEGKMKGCRFHLQTMLLDFQKNGWVNSKSDGNNNIDDFLPFVYTKVHGNPNMVVERSSIDEGTFLGPHH